MDSDKNSIEVPFFSFLSNLSFSKFGSMHYFDANTLFWSLTRLFDVYFRIITSCLLFKENGSKHYVIFLAEDIENFIIRFRVVLNDLAYILRKFYPEQIRKLVNPRGKIHPLNKEVSFNGLFKYVKSNPDFHPELCEVFKKYEAEILSLIEQREKIIHYKSRASVFYFENNIIEFATISAAFNEPREKTEKGEKIITVPVFDFVNSQMLFLHNFINLDLLGVYNQFIKDKGWEYKEISGSSRMSCMGIGVFRKVNNL